jgi:hypothetical protein
MLGHPVIARVGNEEGLGPLLGLRPEASFTPVAGIAGVEEIAIVALQAREPGDGPIMVDSESVLSLEAIRKAAVDALTPELDLEERLKALVVAKAGRVLVS